METNAASASEDPQDQSSRSEEKSLPLCYPKWRDKPAFGGNPEALAWTLISMSMAIQVVGSGAFLATAILRIAEEAYTCRLDFANTTDVDLMEECGPGVGSLNPSSLLTAYALVIGITATLMLPFIGAVIDYTRHRLLIGRIVSILYLAFLCPLMFLNEDNYVKILCCHGCSVFLGWFVVAIQYSYLPDLTDSEMQLLVWTKQFTIWTYIGMIVYLAFIIILVVLTKNVRNDILTCKIGMAVSFAINVIMMILSWWVLFDKRKPLHERPANSSSLCTLGFKQLYGTTVHIFKNYHGLKWFFIHLCFSDAGWQSFGIILLTYFTDFMRLNALQTTIAFEISLLGSVPGAITASFVARRLDPIQSSKFNMINMMIVISVFVSILTGVGQAKRAYAIVAFIGFCGGWKYSMDRLIGSSIIPEGQDTEMMGVFLFAGQCLSWLPLLVYTIMNEAGISPRISVAVLMVYLLISLTALFMVGSYADARASVGRECVYGGNSSTPIASEEMNSKTVSAVQPSTMANEASDQSLEANA